MKDQKSICTNASRLAMPQVLNTTLPSGNMTKAVSQWYDNAGEETSSNEDKGDDGALNQSSSSAAAGVDYESKHTKEHF